MLIVPLMDSLRRYPCPECGSESAFEQPLCSEGHGVDCPDLACIDCGTALTGLAEMVIVDARPAAAATPASRAAAA